MLPDILKPSNVLFENRVVKVVDFGIATTAPEARSTAGTLEYMAPELLLGQPPTPASDLYAVGVIAFQLLTGRYPYNRDSMTRMVLDLLGTISDPSMAQHAAALLGLMHPLAAHEEQTKRHPETDPMAPLHELNGPVARVLRKLLARQPADRYQDAAEVLADLSATLGESLPLETLATRESFLQSSKLIGREAEYETLATALKQAQAHRGSAWLIGGESGAGKSRLLDELRALSLVRGALVLRGQAQSLGGRPFEVWQSVLRPLCLRTALSDMEAGVIKALVPDLADLLGREVEDALPLDGQGNQARMFNTIAEVILRQQEPTVVILEDLHWAGPESLAVLRRLAAQVEDRALLLLGSYRNDEAPQLPAELAGVQVLPLPRLSTAHIATLSALMLGEPGRKPDIIALIEKETEGNIFFIVEVVRALAEEAGELSAVGQRTLPQQVFSGGIKTVIQRRLDRVPKDAQPLLRLAAVAGRQLDLKMLHTLAPEQDLEAWLHVCADAAVLEVYETQWRFAHDKLRERLLEDLSAEEARSSHRQVGQAIENSYEDLASHAAALAEHFVSADDTAKAIRYGILAGERALAGGALEEAATRLKQVQALQGRAGAALMERVLVGRLLMTALLGLGKLEESRILLEQLMDKLGHPPLKQSWQVAGALLHELGRQALFLVQPSLVQPPRDPDERQRLEQLSTLCQEATHLYFWLGDKTRLMHLWLLEHNLGELLHKVPVQASSFSSLAYLLHVSGMPALAQRYLQKGRTFYARCPDVRPRILFLISAGSLDICLGNWGKAAELLRQGTALARQIGHGEDLMHLLMQSAVMNLWQGNMAEAESAFSEVGVLAERDGAIRWQTYHVIWIGLQELRQGHFEAAASMFMQAGTLARQLKDLLGELFATGQQALCALRLGQPEKARELAESGLHMLDKAGFLSHACLEGCPSILEVYLTLWEQTQSFVHSPLARIAMQRKLRRALGYLRGYAKIYALGRPRLALHQGRYAWLQGRTEQARQSLEQCLRLAEQLSMPYEQALAHQWLGKIAKQQARRTRGWEDVDWQRHLKTAQALFMQVRATWEAQQLAQLLDENNSSSG